jgi:hypothetical protein
MFRGRTGDSNNVEVSELKVRGDIFVVVRAVIEDGTGGAIIIFVLMLANTSSNGPTCSGIPNCMYNLISSLICSIF